jgi:hypothetical protein
LAKAGALIQAVFGRFFQILVLVGGETLQMKRFTYLGVGLLVLAGVPSAYCDTTIVNDNFESYADQAAMLAAWPSTAAGNVTTALVTDAVNYPNIQGHAAEFDGSVGFGASTANRWATPFSIVPDATHSILLTADIGDDATSANKKNTVGLRNSSGANIIEIGVFNANPCPFYCMRAVNFPGGDQLTPGATNPTWAQMPLPATLDTPGEVGKGFNRYQVEITPTTLTFRIDLHADGIINDTASPNFGLQPQSVITCCNSEFRRRPVVRPADLMRTTISR